MRYTKQNIVRNEVRVHNGRKDTIADDDLCGSSEKIKSGLRQCLQASVVVT